MVRLLGLDIFSRQTGAQQGTLPLTPTELAFIQNTAFPRLDATETEKSLEKLAEVLWNLCLWERQRTTSLDTKAATLTGLSSLAAAVVSASTLPGVNRAEAVSGFFDADVFAALEAYKTPVGDMPKFHDADPYRCFLRETVLQRWLIYRNYCDSNDRKSRHLAVAQWSAAIAVASLLATLTIAVRN
jgi:hypothetical protein